VATRTAKNLRVLEMKNKKRVLMVNDSRGSLGDGQRILVQCSTPVARDAVKRMNIDGVEHVVISSKTLPDDVVMNGGLYPGDEIAKGFKTLERTLAPVEHPTDTDGNFISAADPTAIHNFYAGAFNDNVRREDGRVMVDKVVNVQEAKKTDRGKRLLDRIAEIETNDQARPIHTSVGVFVEVEETAETMQNNAGQEYTWIARNMIFGHDAILLDSVGAAQPHQGVGMAVNGDGAKFDVLQSLVTIDAEPVSEMSHNEIREALQSAISKPPYNGDWVADIFDGFVIYEANETLFQAPYIIDGTTAKITGIPQPVVRDVSYVPKTNENKGDAMRDLMLKALADAGLSVNADITDADLLAKYNELQASQESGDDGEGEAVAQAVANALKPVTDKLDSLEQKFNSQDDQEKDELAELIGNSEKYPGLDKDAAAALPLETLKGMAANCQTSHGVPLTVNNSGNAAESHDYAMPE